MSTTDTTTDRFAGTWGFAPVHSSADFSVKYLVAKFRGGFSELDATFENGQLAGSVKVASIQVKDENLVAHLQGPDFFDAEQHPEISFRSTSLEVDGDDVTIEGDLTLKGVTKPLHATGKVSGPTEDFMGNTRLGFTFATTIDRDAYGVSWNADLPKGGKALGNDVELIVELEFHKG
ncbi:YceI family protein [Paraconexibacter antarcticus]|uniref:YceI family protein n=1 Tax=Paraconexibacter antarcticus TaxID=2949664 RepID=A0ABY5DNB1_9ACTN|nr:YceI family protein [Paraconexibacter antarcticus]UTI63515.1 YceI family protein [Paraconexibacter antarcticus]